ncbi:retrovirus-related pol polyprotein from transposon TNT 1-94 [Tanacetum coccineum]
MDSIIPIGQKNTLASRMELYMQNRDNGRLILESVEHGPLIWPTIEENRVTRIKKYDELSATEKIQADCDLKATNIILQGLPYDIYSLVNHHRVAKDLWEKVQLLMQALNDYHTINVDQLHAYLEQYKLHANEFQQQQQFSPSQSPQYGSNHPTQHYSTTYPSTPHAITYPSAPYPNAYSSTVHQEACPQPQSVPQIEYTVSTVNQQTHLAEFPQIDSGLAVPVFKQGDDPIDAINKMMSFLSTVGRQNSYAAGTSGTRANTSGTGGNYLGQQRVVKCFNCQGEGHMARQCPKSKRKRDASWYRENVLLVEAQRNGKVLNEEELEFLADPSIAEAKVVLMANLSSYGSDVLYEVPYFDNTNNDMLNQSVQEMPYSKPSYFVEHPENEIHSDSNIISYSQYLIELQNAAVQDTNSSAQQDALILSVFEQLSNQVTNCNKVNNDNQISNESLSADLERYKEHVKLLEERQNMDLCTREKLIINDIIQDKDVPFADFEKEINSLNQTLSEQLKEEESLTKTFNVFKMNQRKKKLGILIKRLLWKRKLKNWTILFAKLNRLSKDFGKRFIPQRELSDEQALYPIIDQSASSPVKIEAPRELPKKGNGDLLNEVTKVQTVFNQMEAAVQQYHVDKQCFEIQKKQFLIEND